MDTDIISGRLYDTVKAIGNTNKNVGLLKCKIFVLQTNSLCVQVYIFLLKRKFILRSLNTRREIYA